MSSLEIPSVYIPDSKPLRISNTAQRMAQEFVRLCDVTLSSPEAMITLTDQKTIHASIQHRTQPDITLRAGHIFSPVYRHRIGQTTIERRPTNYVRERELCVIGDGMDMVVTIDDRHLPTVDMTEDPFSELVMGYFRSHCQTN